MIKNAFMMVATEYAEANLRSLRMLTTPFEVAVIISGDYANEKGFTENHISQLEKMGFTTDVIHIPNGMDYKNIYEIKYHIDSWLDQNQPRKVIINNTGGSKLTAIAIDRITCERKNCNAYYQSIHDEILWYDFDPQTKKYQYNIKTQNDVNTRLQDAGFSIKHSDFNHINALFFHYANALVSMLADDKETTLAFISYINQQLTTIKSKKVIENDAVNIGITLKNLSDDFRKRLAELSKQSDYELFKIVGHAELVLNNADVLDLMKGGWLEIYTVFCAISAAHVDLSQASLNTEITKNGVKNEMDVILSKLNSLYLFECKTSNFGTQTNNKLNKLNDILYKLHSVSQEIGIQAKPAFVSLYKINYQTVIKRANYKNIRLFHGDDILNLKSLLEEWFNE